MDFNQLDDREIVKAILNRDSEITINYLFKQCSPIFKSTFNKYYTDCESWNELVNQIYVYIMVPNKETGISKLASFQFRCSLYLWLKIVTDNYCHQLYAKKIDIIGDNIRNTDNFSGFEQSIDFDFRALNSADVKKIIRMMPNQRYRKLIEYRYIKDCSNEETAALLSTTMANYYNMHRRAKAQFVAALRKEGLL